MSNNKFAAVSQVRLTRRCLNRAFAIAVQPRRCVSYTIAIAAPLTITLRLSGLCVSALPRVFLSPDGECRS